MSWGMMPSMMRIEVLCFAAARDVVGGSPVELVLEPGTTVDDALAMLAARQPGLAALYPSLRCAVIQLQLP